MKPWEFGKLTLWQMHNLFGFKGKKPPPNPKQLFWDAARKNGESEFLIYKRWTEQVQPKVKNAR